MKKIVALRGRGGGFRATILDVNEEHTGVFPATGSNAQPIVVDAVKIFPKSA